VAFLLHYSDGDKDMGTTLTAMFGELAQPPLEVESEERGDQRARSRYPISLDLQYKLLRGGRIERAGSGKTLNISSGGLLFETGEPLPERGLVEVSMQWPYLLQGVCSLKLVMRGRIVRSAADCTAIRAQFHEFRTAGLRREPPQTLSASGK